MTGRALSVAVIAPPWYPIPPDGYGGIELVVALLAHGLEKAGHTVRLLAAEGSREGAVMLADAAWSKDLGSSDGILRELTYLSRAVDYLRDNPDVDIIHDHAGFASTLTASLLDIAPVVHTVHGPIHELQHTLYQELGRRSGIVSISRHQQSTASDLNWLGTVYNAVDIAALPPSDGDGKEGYLLCLARVSPEKGQHVAIDVAAQTGCPLVLAGKVQENPEGEQYYEEYVRPAVERGAVNYIENVGGAEKAALIANARALIAPLQWDEPFGLMMAEALAAGTPVIATPRGAAPEIVEDGVTGFLADDVDGLADAVRHADEIDPAACTARAVAMFSEDAMTDGYIDIYRRVLAAT
jgi:glycosyltransferase involved in cell wall biosynthesis